MKNTDWRKAYAINIEPEDMEITLLIAFCLHNRTGIYVQNIRLTTCNIKVMSGYKLHKYVVL
jgi:hypothetical protein